MFVLSVEIAALYISVIEERRHLKLPDFTLFKNELLPFRQNCVMVLIKTKKTVCLEENTGLADVLDDAGKRKRTTTVSLQTYILTNGVLKFQEIIDIAQFFFQYK